MSEKAKEKKARPIFCQVTSASMDKSRVATIQRRVMHAEYGKHMDRRSKIMFHDEKNETVVGDYVLIAPCRPMSKRKRFSLTKIVEKNFHK
jgi:small subunit ribosomal protein S17